MSNQDIYRIVCVHNGYPRQDTAKLYQGNEIRNMLTDLLEWELEHRAFPLARPYSNEQQLSQSLSERWRKWLTGKDRNKVKDDHRRGGGIAPHRREIRLEKHTTEGWVNVDYDIVEPAVVLHKEIEA